MCPIEIIFSVFVILNMTTFISSQYYASDEELRGLHNRKKRPNNHSGGPCGRQNLNDPENPKFLGLAYVNVENTYNCGTGGHYTNTYGGGGGQNGGLFGGGGNHKPHRPNRPFQNHGNNNQNHNDGQDGGQNGVQSDYSSGTGNGGGGGGGLFGNKPNRPFAGLVNSISSGLSSGFGSSGSNDEAQGGPGTAFGGLVSSVVSNVGTFVSNNNPFQGGANPFQSSSSSFSPSQTIVEDVPNDPAPVFEQDKLPFFSNNLFQKPHHESSQSNQDQGFFFGLFDGSIINSYLSHKPGHNNQQNNNNYRPTTQRPQYGINNNFVATQTSQTPPISEVIKPVHEDYDLITEAYSLHRPVAAPKPPAHVNPYSNLRPGQYISAYNSLNGVYNINRIDNINPNRVIKQINKGVNKFLDLLL